MSKFNEPNVRFLSLLSLYTSRCGFLLAGGVLFTLLSLLNFAYSAALQRPISFFFSLSRVFHLSNFRFSLFFHQGTRQPYAKTPRNSCKDTPAAFLRRQRQGRGSISFAKLEKQALYAGGHKNHFLSLLLVTSLAARPQALDNALGGEGSRSDALLPAINGRILQLFATMETNCGGLYVR